MSKSKDGREPAAPGDRRQCAAIEPEAAAKDLKRKDREARLAEALRENLRRRKSGSRKPEARNQKDEGDAT